MTAAFETRLFAQLNASERRWNMERDGVEYMGDTPCIPPHALAQVVERVLLRAGVTRDNQQEGGI